MSRIANKPISLPKLVSFDLNDRELVVKSSRGVLALNVNAQVLVKVEEGFIFIAPKDAKDRKNVAIAGTFRSLLSNMILGVSEGFQKKLELHGVGYKAQAKGKNLLLNLGFSHPIDYQVPEDVIVETPSPTEVILKSINKQLLGQVAAEIRSFRPPEPYKGKGLRYADEQIVRKETKKK